MRVAAYIPWIRYIPRGKAYIKEMQIVAIMNRNRYDTLHSTHLDFFFFFFFLSSLFTSLEVLPTYMYPTGGKREKPIRRSALLRYFYFPNPSTSIAAAIWDPVRSVARRLYWAAALRVDITSSLIPSSLILARDLGESIRVLEPVPRISSSIRGVSG